MIVDYGALNHEEKSQLAQAFGRLTQYPEWAEYVNWLDFQIAHYDNQLARSTFTDLSQITTLQEKRALCILLKDAPGAMIDLMTPDTNKMPEIDPYDKPKAPPPADPTITSN